MCMSECVCVCGVSVHERVGCVCEVRERVCVRERVL